MYFRIFPEMQAATINDRRESPANGPRPLETFTAASFHPHVNTEFTLRTAERFLGSLVLAKVTERPLSGNVAQFTLIFQGTAEMESGGGNCLMQHRVLGSLDLFIAPIGAPDSRGRKYQACFSRILKAGYVD